MDIQNSRNRVVEEEYRLLSEKVREKKAGKLM